MEKKECYKPNRLSGTWKTLNSTTEEQPASDNQAWFQKARYEPRMPFAQLTLKIVILQ
jgi:hypothetical protein